MRRIFRLAAAAGFAAFASSGIALAACQKPIDSSGAKAILDFEESVTKAGNSATYSNQFEFTKPTLVLISVWSTAEFQPPNPTWFLTAIKTGIGGDEVKTVAQSDSY